MNKKIPSKEPKDAEVKKLKRLIKRLEKEITRLKSELKTYELAFERTEKFLKDKTDEISLEDLIDAANKKFNLRQIQQKQSIKDACKKCLNHDLKKIPTNFGYVSVCSKCGDREVVNENFNSNDDDDGFTK